MDNTEINLVKMTIEQSLMECTLCVSIFIDPVTIPCGHTFCRACIIELKKYLPARAGSECPHCHEKLPPTSTLKPNIVIAKIVNSFKKLEPYKTVATDAIPRFQVEDNEDNRLLQAFQEQQQLQLYFREEQDEEQNVVKEDSESEVEEEKVEIRRNPIRNNPIRAKRKKTIVKYKKKRHAEDNESSSSSESESESESDYVYYTRKTKTVEKRRKKSASTE
jgi:hypothetical protein